YEMVRGGGQERMRVVAQRLPAGEVDDTVGTVDAETAHQAVVVADEPRAAAAVDGDHAAEGVEVVEDIVAHGIPGGGAVDVDAPARIGGVDDGVVDYEVAARAGGAVDAVEADAAGVVV